MPDDAAQPTGRITSPRWRVLVQGTVYGPYTLAQVQAFVGERRIGASSRLAEGDSGDFRPACEHAALRSLFETGDGREDSESGVSNYLVIARLSGTGQMQLMGALNRLGKFAEVMPGVWALRSQAKQSRVRERLQATISAGDQVMIANASTGRLAWLNLGPEADVHIRRVWDADLQGAA